MEKLREDKFIAPKDVVDRLKLENAVVTPEVSETTPLAVAKIISIVANTYYPYIPTETLERLKDLPDRVIVTDTFKFNTLSKRKGRDIDGFFAYGGNYMVVKNPENMEYVWEKLSEETKRQWSQVYGDEKEARKAVREDRFGKVLVHETIHGIHSVADEILEGFIENGVNYYAREITNEAKIIDFSLFDKWEADIYQSYLEKHGEKVHRVFFGLETGRDQISLLMGDYKKHAQEILQRMKSGE